jgi:hypothetical protein
MAGSTFRAALKARLKPELADRTRTRKVCIIAALLTLLAVARAEGEEMSGIRKSTDPGLTIAGQKTNLITPSPRGRLLHAPGSKSCSSRGKNIGEPEAISLPVPMYDSEQTGRTPSS